MKLKCVCGKESNEFKELTSSMVDNCRDSGFIYTMTETSDIIWMCYDCNNKARELASQLLEVVGNRKLHFRYLLRDVSLNEIQ